MSVTMIQTDSLPKLNGLWYIYRTTIIIQQSCTDQGFNYERRL